MSHSQELLPLLDHLGRRTDLTKDRTQVHIDGNWHASSHVWFIDSKNRILLQQRALTKKLYPGMWCAPVSGHVAAESDSVQTAIKESKEELNVTLSEQDFFLQAIIRGTFDDPAIGLQEKEYISVFIATKIPQIDLGFSNDEVAGFKWFDFTEFSTMINKLDKSLVPAFEEYEIIVSYVKHNLLK